MKPYALNLVEARGSRKPKSWAARTSPFDSQTYNGLRVHFSGTVGEKPEVEVALV
jgi:hypothetical protein